MGDRGEEERRWSQTYLSNAQGEDKRQRLLIDMQEKKTFLNFHSQVTRISLM